MKAVIFNNKKTIVYGCNTIYYSLFYCDRKTMEIAVHPDSSVIIKAPTNSNVSLIEKKLNKKARWIVKQINYFKQFNPKTPKRCYVNGESHFYLGRQYRLKLIEDVNTSIKLSQGLFLISFRGVPTSEMAEKLLDKWYLEKAQSQFKESLDHCWQKFSNFNFGKPNLRIKRMQKRWGSLSKEGVITLNTNLIKAPRECINYVVSHELCHLKYHNHSPEFYKLLEHIIPNWEKIKHKLKIKCGLVYAYEVFDYA
jgi:predicted metal-dependent hydrolase